MYTNLSLLLSPLSPKVNTMSQHPISPHVVAVGGLDREVKLFDIRKFGTWNQKELSKTGNWKTSKVRGG